MYDDSVVDMHRMVTGRTLETLQRTINLVRERDVLMLRLSRIEGVQFRTVRSTGELELIQDLRRELSGTSIRATGQDGPEKSGAQKWNQPSISDAKASSVMLGMVRFPHAWQCCW